MMDFLILTSSSLMYFLDPFLLTLLHCIFVTRFLMSGINIPLSYRLLSNSFLSWSSRALSFLTNSFYFSHSKLSFKISLRVFSIFSISLSDFLSLTLIDFSLSSILSASYPSISSLSSKSFLSSANLDFSSLLLNFSSLTKFLKLMTSFVSSFSCSHSFYYANSSCCISSRFLSSRFHSSSSACFLYFSFCSCYSLSFSLASCC